MTVFGYLIEISLQFYFSIFSLVWIEKIYQALKTAFDHISRHLEVLQKYLTTKNYHIFNSLLGALKHGQTCVTFRV